VMSKVPASVKSFYFLPGFLFKHAGSTLFIPAARLPARTLSKHSSPVT